MRILALGIVLSAACTPAPVSSSPSMPWMRGFTTTATNDVVAARTSERLRHWQDCEEPCDDVGGIELTADVAAPPGNETILASYAQGLVVLDGTGHLLARGPRFAATGSADELLAIAVGDAMLETPVIAVSARVGGRRESEVWLELYRVAADSKLERLFAAVVEEHDDQGDKVGSVTFVPGGLVYRAPRATAPDSWTFDRRAGRYLYRGAIAPEPQPPSAPGKAKADLVVKVRDVRR